MFNFIQELKTYVQIGIAMELVRSILKHFNSLKSNLFKGVWTIMRKFNFKFVLFAIGYPSSYRVSVSLNHDICTNSKSKHADEGFHCFNFRFSLASLTVCMDWKQNSRTFLLHFWPADFFTFIRSYHFQLIVSHAPSKFHGNAFDDTNTKSLQLFRK